LFAITLTVSTVHAVMFSCMHGLTYLVVGQMLKWLDYRREGVFSISFHVIICLLILLYWH